MQSCLQLFRVCLCYTKQLRKAALSFPMPLAQIQYHSHYRMQQIRFFDPALLLTILFKIALFSMASIDFPDLAFIFTGIIHHNPLRHTVIRFCFQLHSEIQIPALILYQNISLLLSIDA